MKILLANLPWINNNKFRGVRAGSRWPHLVSKKEHLPYFPFPFYLAYAAALLKKEGFSPSIIALPISIAFEIYNLAFEIYDFILTIFSLVKIYL